MHRPSLVAHLECPDPPTMVYHFWYNLGKLWGNFGDTAGKCLEHWKTLYVLNVPSTSPMFPQIIPKVVHHGWRGQDILNVPLGIILDTLFWLILNFTGLGHHGHITQKTKRNPG